MTENEQAVISSRIHESENLKEYYEKLISYENDPKSIEKEKEEIKKLEQKIAYNTARLTGHI